MAERSSERVSYRSAGEWFSKHNTEDLNVIEHPAEAIAPIGEGPDDVVIALKHAKAVHDVECGHENEGLIDAEYVDVVDVEPKSHLFPTEESYENYVALVNRAIDVFGDANMASKWLSQPNVALGNKIPLEVVQDHGYSKGRVEEVLEPIFVRIEHGIYA